MHPTSTESGIDELDEVVVVPSEVGGYAASALTMNGKVLYYSVGTSVQHHHHHHGLPSL